MLRRIRSIIRKEVFQTLREPRMRILLIGPPLIQLVIFGYAVNLDVESNPIAWVDQDQTFASRRLRAAFEGSRYFRITDYPRNDHEVRSLLDQGEVRAVVKLLPGFSRSIHGAQPARIQVLVDGTNSNTASIIAGYVQQLTARFASSEGKTTGGESEVNPGRVALQPRVWFNLNLESRDYFIPGVVVNIIGLVTVMLTAMAVVREKEIGTMEQLMVTPIRPIELMLGKTLPFAVVGFLEVILVTGLALLIFGIPFRGSALLLLAASGLFLLTTLGAGLLISTLSQTQQQAMMGSFFFFMPAFMLSGFAFPIRNMPVAVQYLTYLDPMRYYLEITRGVFLKGTGVQILWPQLAALFLYGVAMIVLSSLRFHKRLD